MSTILATMSTLLDNAWTEFFKNNGSSETGWLTQFFDVLYPVLYALMAVVGAAGAVYAIFLGISMAKADTTEKREEAKKRMINTIVAVVVAIALILFFNQILPLILNAFVGKEKMEEVKPEGMIQAVRLMLGK